MIEANEKTAGSAWLVAMIVTTSGVVILAGAEYIPKELMLPAPAGLMDQVTGKVALNCWENPPYT